MILYKYFTGFSYTEIKVLLSNFLKFSNRGGAQSHKNGYNVKLPKILDNDLRNQKKKG